MKRKRAALGSLCANNSWKDGMEIHSDSLPVKRKRAALGPLCANNIRLRQPRDKSGKTELRKLQKGRTQKQQAAAAESPVESPVVRNKRVRVDVVSAESDGHHEPTTEQAAVGTAFPEAQQPVQSVETATNARNNEAETQRVDPIEAIRS